MPRASKRIIDPTTVLEDQSKGLYGFGKTAAIVPDAAMYGIYGPQYAGALAAGANNEAAGATQQIFDRAQLHNQADAENTRYAKEMALSRQAQEVLQRNDARYGFISQVGQRGVDYAKEGMAGVEHVGTDANGNPTIVRDPTLDAAGNALHQDAMIGSTMKDKAGAIKDLGDTGYGFAAPEVGRLLRAPTNPEPLPTTAYMTPHDTTEQFKVQHRMDEGLTAEQQMEVAQIKADAVKKGLQATVALDPATGEQVWGVKGDPAAVAQWYAEHPNIKPPKVGAMPDPDANPTADGHGAGPSATKGTVHGFYAAIDSHKGMRIDPITGERKMHKGDDIPKPMNTPFPAEGPGRVVHAGPIRGFGPNAVVVQYDDGQQVLYGHGNAANVKVGQRVNTGDTLGLVGSQGRSTGPHVHRQVLRTDGPVQQQAQAQGVSPRGDVAARFKANGFSVAMQGSNIVVTSPTTGKQAVYDPSGRRLH